MAHTGVCVTRQYATFAGIVPGQKTVNFFETLVSRSYARAYRCRHYRARVYHIHHKPLYRLIGEPNSRHRRPLSAVQVVEGLIRLDALLFDPGVEWLATDEDTIVRLRAVNRIDPDNPPHVTIGDAEQRRMHLFPEKLTIGLDPTGRVVVLYVATAVQDEQFRAFLHRHADLLAMLPTWTLRIVAPRELALLMDRYLSVAHEVLAQPLDSRTLEYLRWYFDRRRQFETSAAGRLDMDEERFYELHQAFRSVRYQVLYRQWRREGEAALERLSSSSLKAAISRGAGRIDAVVLPHSYRHLSPVFNRSDREQERADEREEIAARPQPPYFSDASISAATKRDVT